MTRDLSDRLAIINPDSRHSGEQLWVERLIRLVPRSKTSVKVQKTLAGRHESDLVGRRQAQLYPAEKTDQSGQGDDDQGIGPGENKDQRAKAGQQKSSPVVVS